jgi:chemotaxis protein methyltransferase CheR
VPAQPERHVSPLAGITAAEYEDFRNFLEQACGIVLGQNKHYLVQSRLGRIVTEKCLSGLGELVIQLRREYGGGPLRQQVIEAMTTNETSWFRDSHPFTILKDRIFDDFVKRGLRLPRIWSAACSTGQEPYSISMAAQEFITANPAGLSDVQIVATDISPAILTEAENGCYDGLSVSRGLSTQLRARYFEPVKGHHGDRWKINAAIRKRVRFTRTNLLEGYAGLGRFDVVFCRNVLIYFSQASKVDILGRLADILNPGGYLFLGSSESLQQHSGAFDTIRCNPGIVFRKK